MFRGAYHVLFTYLIPLTVMTSFPADALLRRLSVGQALWALCGTALLLCASRWLWVGSLRRYTSASS